MYLVVGVLYCRCNTLRGDEMYLVVGVLYCRCNTLRGEDVPGSGSVVLQV